MIKEVYAYDAVGNRTKGPAAYNTAYQHDDDNRMLVARGVGQTRGYDVYGNRTTQYIDADSQWSYKWDGENQLINAERVDAGAVSQSVTFLYDPLGRRIEKRTVDSLGLYKLDTFVYDGEDIVLRRAGRRDTNGAWLAWNQVNTHGPGIDEPLASNSGGTVNTYYHADGLGSIVKTTDNSHAIMASVSYDSYGTATITGTGGSYYLFTGRENDTDIGLLYYRARYYSYTDGRFLNKDPIGFAGGDVNVYNYVQGNPVNLIDPSGLWSFTFGGYAGPGFEISSGVDKGIPFLTGRIGLGLGGGFSWDPNGGIPGPAIENPCEGGAVLAVSGAANFNAGPISANLEKGDARNYSNRESSFYGGMGYSFGGEIGESMKGIKAGASIGTSLTLYGEL